MAELLNTELDELLAELIGRVLIKLAELAELLGELVKLFGELAELLAELAEFGMVRRNAELA